MNQNSSELLMQLLTILNEEPTAVLPEIEETINKYKPLVYCLLHQFLNIYKDYSHNTEYQETLARIKRNTYNAYLEAGFTEDQAFALLINDNLQLLKNIQKYSIKTSNLSSPSRNN